MDELRDLESFRAHAAALEAQIAAAEAAGDDVPAEARLILASLRDLALAVDGLRTTMTGTDADGIAPSPEPEER